MFQAVKELQTSAREAIILLKAMIGEVRANVDEEESAICTLFNSMQVTQASFLHHQKKKKVRFKVIIKDRAQFKCGISF